MSRILFSIEARRIFDVARYTYVCIAKHSNRFEMSLVPSFHSAWHKRRESEIEERNQQLARPKNKQKHNLCVSIYAIQLSKKNLWIFSDCIKTKLSIFFLKCRSYHTCHRWCRWAWAARRRNAVSDESQNVNDRRWKTHAHIWNPIKKQWNKCWSDRLFFFLLQVFDIQQAAFDRPRIANFF